MWGKRSPYPLLVGISISAITMESSMDVSQKNKNKSTIQSSHTCPEHIPKGM
jgi:hypothetical protein